MAEDFLKRKKQEQKDQQLIKQIQQFVDQLDNKENLEKLTQSVDAISETLRQLEMPQQNIAEITAALADFTQVPQNQDIKPALLEFGQIISESLMSMQDAISQSQNALVLADIQNSLSAIKKHMQLAESAEWSFAIARDSNGDMVSVKVSRIK